MESIAITNREELQAEIARLKGIDGELSLAIKSRFNSPKSIFLTLGTLFPRPVDADGNTRSAFLHPDWLKLASRFVIPFALNKTIFRNSNFLIKMVVDLVSQKAANQVTTEGAGKLVEEGKTLFSDLWHKIEPLFGGAKTPAGKKTAAAD